MTEKMHNALKELELLPKHIDEALKDTQHLVMDAVITSIDNKIEELENNRQKRNYSSLADSKLKDKIVKNCNKKCGDEGVYHQVQILEDLLKHLKMVRKKK